MGDYRKPSKLIQRTYRVSEEHDAFIKKQRNKYGESGFIRMLIDAAIKNSRA